MNSRRYLESLKSKPRTESDDIRQYIRQYTAISEVLVKKKQLEDYTRGVWFLNGLPGAIRGKVIRKNKVDIDKPETIVFKELAKTATDIYTSERTVREFSDTTERAEGMSDLVDRLGMNAATRDSAKFTARPAPPVVPQNNSVEELTDLFGSLALMVKTAAQEGVSQAQGFNRPGRGNQGAYLTNLSGKVDTLAPPMSRPNPPTGAAAGAAAGAVGVSSDYEICLYY